MHFPSKRSAFASVLILLAGFSVNAGVVYDNGAPDSIDGYGITHWIQADDFALGRPARLEGMTFWDDQVGTGQFNDAEHAHDWFIVRIFADNGNNAPGALLFNGYSTNLSRSAVATGTYPKFVNTFNFAPTPDGAPTAVDLPAGTYWVGLHNGPFSNDIVIISTPTGPLYFEVFFWTATTQRHGAASNSQEAPYTRGWDSNACPNCTPRAPDPDLAFQLQGALAPQVQNLQRSSGTPQISFTTEAGRSYRVDFSSTVPQPSWQAVSGAQNVSGTGGVVTISDSDPNARNVPRRFYRVVLL